MAAVLMFSSTYVSAQQCRVLDPELQHSYRGPCVSGLAEGEGSAAGIAEYRGGFKAGRKHGKGVKTWPNGDRYAGEFVDDRKEGSGEYRFGRGPWAGEHYTGGFRNDQRHGHGVYVWASGDRYAGPWRDGAAVGPPTPMMQARAKFEQEAREALGVEGRLACRSMRVGIAETEWIRGAVVAVDGNRIAVRISEAGHHAHRIGAADVKPGNVLWDAVHAWTPCW